MIDDRFAASFALGLAGNVRLFLYLKSKLVKQWDHLYVGDRISRRFIDGCVVAGRASLVLGLYYRGQIGAYFYIVRSMILHNDNFLDRCVKEFFGSGQEWENYAFEAACEITSVERLARLVNHETFSKALYGVGTGCRVLETALYMFARYIKLGDPYHTHATWLQLYQLGVKYQVGEAFVCQGNEVIVPFWAYEIATHGFLGLRKYAMRQYDQITREEYNRFVTSFSDDHTNRMYLHFDASLRRRMIVDAEEIEVLYCKFQGEKRNFVTGKPINGICDHPKSFKVSIYLCRLLCGASKIAKCMSERTETRYR